MSAGIIRQSRSSQLPLRTLSSSRPPSGKLGGSDGAELENLPVVRRQQSKESGNTGVNVKVILRCRPLASYEKNRSNALESVVECREGSKEVTVRHARRDHLDKTFSFDGVCGPDTTQRSLFNNYIIPLVDEVLQGFNCTIFAYGQTGTGKTYTMEGEWPNDLTSEPPTPVLESAGKRPDLKFKLPAEVGVIPRSLALIFERLENSTLEYSVKVSHLEIYNEELFDLLQDGERQNLRIYDRDQADRLGVATRGLAVDKLEEVSVRSLPEVKKLLTTACRRRRTAETILNRQSSRSHSIFTVIITMKESSLEGEGEDVIRIGKLNLVDLAGSENIQRSGTSHIKDRTKEAGMINQSLLTLGRVINALVEHSAYIPYRDSKLTRLLQDSLGGRTKTCIIATVSPSPLSCDETLSTLDYAHRAKHIRNRPEVNQRMTQKLVMRELTQEVERLKQELAWARDKSGSVNLSKERYDEMESKISTSQSRIAELQSLLDGRMDECKELKGTLAEVESQNNELKGANEALKANDTKIQSQLAMSEECLKKSLKLGCLSSLIIGYKVVEASQDFSTLDKQSRMISIYRDVVRLLFDWIDKTTEKHRAVLSAQSQTIANLVQSTIDTDLKTMAEETQQTVSSVTSDLLSTIKAYTGENSAIIEGILRDLKVSFGTKMDKTFEDCFVPEWKSFLENSDLIARAFTEEEDEKWTAFFKDVLGGLVCQDIDNIKSDLSSAMKTLKAESNQSSHLVSELMENFRNVQTVSGREESRRLRSLIRELKSKIELQDKQLLSAQDRISELLQSAANDRRSIVEELEATLQQCLTEMMSVVKKFALSEENRWTDVQAVTNSNCSASRLFSGSVLEKIQHQAETNLENIKEREGSLDRVAEHQMKCSLHLRDTLAAFMRRGDEDIEKLTTVQAEIKYRIECRQSEHAQSLCNTEQRRSDLIEVTGTRLRDKIENLYKQVASDAEVLKVKLQSIGLQAYGNTIECMVKYLRDEMHRITTKEYLAYDTVSSDCLEISQTLTNLVKECDTADFQSAMNKLKCPLAENCNIPFCKSIDPFVLRPILEELNVVQKILDRETPLFTADIESLLQERVASSRLNSIQRDNLQRLLQVLNSPRSRITSASSTMSSRAHSHSRISSYHSADDVDFAHLDVLDVVKAAQRAEAINGVGPILTSRGETLHRLTLARQQLKALTTLTSLPLIDQFSAHPDVSDFGSDISSTNNVHLSTRTSPTNLSAKTSPRNRPTNILLPCTMAMSE